MLKINWHDIIWGAERGDFIVEVLFRTSFMFLVILIGLVILGKRGVRQLSVFELVVIIGLGSAAGDPMLYREVGLLPALAVFILVIGFYILITNLVGRNRKFETLIEGKPICLVEDGQFAIENFKKENLGQYEFFTELRLKGVSHLGQVENAIIETNGDISIYFYENDKIKAGLPIMPGALEKQTKVIINEGKYSCTFCGNTQLLKPADKHTCNICNKDEWVEASNKKRVS